jgi:hypothetical protein
MAGMDMLDRFRQGWHEPVEVVEHEPPGELVTPTDIVRVDDLGRHVVVVPAGTVPHSRVALSAQDRDALIEPPEPPKDGTLEPGHAGFTPRNITLGFTIEHPD